MHVARDNLYIKCHNLDLYGHKSNVKVMLGAAPLPKCTNINLILDLT